MYMTAQSDRGTEGQVTQLEESTSCVSTGLTSWFQKSIPDPSHLYSCLIQLSDNLSNCGHTQAGWQGWIISKHHNSSKPAHTSGEQGSCAHARHPEPVPTHVPPTFTTSNGKALPRSPELPAPRAPILHVGLATSEWAEERTKFFLHSL